MEWVPQIDFVASSSPCTSMCWRSSSSGSPPLLLVGSEQGAQVADCIAGFLFTPCHEPSTNG